MNTTDPCLPSAAERHLWVWYSPFGLGGVETYLLNMARATARRGVPVWVATVHRPDGPLRADYAFDGVRLLDWSAFYPAYVRHEPPAGACRRLVADLAELRPTLLAVNDCVDFALGAIPLLRRLRAFCTVLDTFHIDGPDDGYLRRRRPLLGVLDGITGTNRNVIDRFRAAFPRAGRVATRYVPNGVSVPGRERQPPGDVLRLLYVGRLAQEQKRILDLPAVLDALRGRGRAFTLTVAGDGPQRDELRDALDRLGLLDRVRLAGFVPPARVLDQYFDHDVLLNLSSYEGFSMSVLEALAAGCVPVCTDLPCLDRSVFRDGVTCRLCPVGQPGRVAEVLAALGRDELARLSGAAREVGRQFTAEATFLRYQDFVDHLRSRRPLRPWPADAAAALAGDWDPTRLNPWLPRPHPVKQFARRLWARLVGPRG
jgi:glycosyltransferase involved in cell wall biosynthesis